MKRVAHSAGYTIVETMIVLAVTGFLFVSIAATWSGRQRSNEFQAAANDTQTRIQQAVSDVQNGYFPDTSRFQCSYSGSGLAFGAAVQGQGTNYQCVFLGKALQFGIQNTDPEQVKQFSIAGYSGANTLSSAKATITPDLTETLKLDSDLKAVKLRLKDDGSTTYDGVAFLMDVGTYKLTELQSGRQLVRAYALTGTIGSPAKSEGTLLNYRATPIGKGLDVCFKSGSTKNYMLATIAANGTADSVTSRISDQVNCGI